MDFESSAGGTNPISCGESIAVRKIKAWRTKDVHKHGPLSKGKNVFSPERGCSSGLLGVQGGCGHPRSLYQCLQRIGDYYVTCIAQRECNTHLYVLNHHLDLVDVACPTISNLESIWTAYEWVTVYHSTTTGAESPAILSRWAEYAHRQQRNGPPSPADALRPAPASACGPL